MPGDDVTHPVPDNTGYITEGQFYLKGGRIEPFGSLSRLKQLVNGKTRADHRAIMDGMIKLYAAYKDSLEKKSMGFQMSPWDCKLLRYGELFEQEMMDLSVNIPLEGGPGQGLGDPGGLFRAPRRPACGSELTREVLAAGSRVEASRHGQDQADQERAQEAEGRAQDVPALPAHACSSKSSSCRWRSASVEAEAPRTATRRARSS